MLAAGWHPTGHSGWLRHQQLALRLVLGSVLPQLELRLGLVQRLELLAQRFGHHRQPESGSG
jgi:hypothetical protein